MIELQHVRKSYDDGASYVVADTSFTVAEGELLGLIGERDVYKRQAVDGEDKAEVYRNWLGLMSGELQETFIKDGSTLTRVLNEDRVYRTLSGNDLILPGRSLMLVRNVGHLMRNPAIRCNGSEVFEGILDAVFTGAIGAIDVQGKNRLGNSRAG